MTVATRSTKLWAVDGLDDVLRALRRLDKEGQRELREAVQNITERHAAAIRNAGARHRDPRVRHVASTVRSAKDRVPTIKVGGAKRGPFRGRPRAGDVLFGTEFGADPAGPNAWRFPSRDAWLYPTLRGRHRQVVNEWERAVDDVLRKWGR
jgi:hypothetical protein